MAKLKLAAAGMTTPTGLRFAYVKTVTPRPDQRNEEGGGMAGSSEEPRAAGSARVNGGLRWQRLPLAVALRKTALPRARGVDFTAITEGA
jgi:hypothetical protein